MNSKYKTPEAFKAALEARLRSAGKTRAIDIATLRQRCVFDRFLARIQRQFGETAVLKGGVALGLLVERARLTRDVDLSLYGQPGDFLDRLQAACRLDLNDFLEFEGVPDARSPTMEGDGVVYEGLRFRIEAKLAGKIYGTRFGLDIGFGDRMFAPPELRRGDDFFSFADLPPTVVYAYAREVHIAEKLHAYTLPRQTENSRVKDLPDIALLAMAGPLESGMLRDSIAATFTHRGSHAVPPSLPAPPTSWTRRYADLAQENNLPWATLEQVHTRACMFINCILTAEDAGANKNWDPETWNWSLAKRRP